MIIKLMPMFSNWLLDELRKKEWTQADLARASGLTTAAISKYMSGRIPERDALKKIARALDTPTERLYQIAGILPPEPEPDLLTKAIMHLVHDLDNDEKNEVLEYVKLRRRLSRQSKDDD